MKHTIQKSLRALVVFTILTGVIYPLAVTGLALLFAPRAATGSIVVLDGRAVGSELIGQKFSKPEYFWGRPSAVDYGTMPGGASQLGPTSQKLKDRVALSLKALGIDPAADKKPYDLLLASGSGLDPDISPESAEFQAPRIARVRGLEIKYIQGLIRENTQGASFGLIGPSRVNVLKLNLALDALKR